MSVSAHLRYVLIDSLDDRMESVGVVQILIVDHEHSRVQSLKDAEVKGLGVEIERESR